MEMGGVEPPSESTLTGTSPGADGYCGEPNRLFPSPKASRHALGSGSFIIHGVLKALQHSRTLLIDALHPNRSAFGEDEQP